MQRHSIHTEPDWVAIDRAFEQLEATGVHRPVQAIGAIPMEAMFDTSPILPPTPLPTIPSKTNGFGGRSRTYRATPYGMPELAPDKPSLGEQLTLVDAVHAEMAEEVEDPQRVFFKWVETTDHEGRTYRTREYIYDDYEIEAIRQKEREAIDTVARAVRIGVYETDPRMKGFPGAKRLEGAEDTYANLMHLLSSRNPESKDPLIQAVLADLQSRLAEDPEERQARQNYYRRYHDTPQWQMTYMPLFER